jgi:hypothetical protein
MAWAMGSVSKTAEPPLINTHLSAVNSTHAFGADSTYALGADFSDAFVPNFRY